MNSRSKFLFKNIGILTISNFSSKILVFLLVPLYTSVLTTAEYGVYDFAISTITLVYPIFTLNIADGVMRYCLDKSHPYEDVASIGIKYILLSIGIFGITSVLIGKIFDFSNYENLLKFLFLYYVFYVINQYLSQLAKGIENVRAMGIAGALSTFMMLLLNLVFLLVFKLGLTGFFCANILSQLASVVYYTFELRVWKKIDICRRNKILEKKMLVYSIPLICTALGWWINNAADKYVVTFMCGVAANGILSVAYKIPSIINTLQGIFVQAWQISAIREYQKTDTETFYGETFAYLNVLLGIVCSGLILLSKPIAYVLYAKEFYQAWQYVPFLLISSVLNSASGFLGAILAAKKDSKNMALSAVYGSAVNIILNIILVKFVGIQGAAIATMISSYVIYCYRKCSINEIKTEQYWKVHTTWILLVAQAVTEIYFGLWYVEIVIIMILLGINYQMIKKISNYFLKICNKKRIYGAR